MLCPIFREAHFGRRSVPRKQVFVLIPAFGRRATLLFVEVEVASLPPLVELLPCLRTTAAIGRTQSPPFRHEAGSQFGIIQILLILMASRTYQEGGKLIEGRLPSLRCRLDPH
ncbi:hypothetical protein HYQ46_007410 [Verticillium longisporum]|nr:hypothetical protein HYQ46_007410 [Verticillium longisporum]